MERNPQAAKPILAAMKNRASCRNFTGQAIEKALLDDLIDTGLMAASGGNLQPYSMIVVRAAKTKKELRRLGGGQPFIEQADTLLVFALDWSRYQIYTRQKHAPFHAPHLPLHFVIGIEDILCVAQTIETAAFLSGLGSCYVGGVLETGAEVAQLLHLPQGAFPIVMLALGHPAPGSMHKPPKLAKQAIVFEEQYHPMSAEEIYSVYEEKYKGMDRHILPPNPDARQNLLAQLFDNLQQTYPREQAEGYLKEIEQNESYNEAQHRYGIHYGIESIRRRGWDMLAGMKQQGCEWE